MKAIKHLAIVMCGAAAFGCAKDGANQGTTAATGDPCDVYLKISTTETRGITDSYVDGTELENAVKILEFYVFDSTGAPDTEVGRTDESTPGTGYKKITTTSNAKTHKITMAGGDDKKIIAVINMNLGDFTAQMDDYDAVKAAMAEWTYSANSTDGYNARTENRTNGFEMTGEKDKFSVTAGSVNNNISINVSRVSTRINAPVVKSTATGFINLDEDDYEEIWGENWATLLDEKVISYRNDGYVVINGRENSDAFFTGNDDGDDRLTKNKITGGVTYVIPDWDKWSATGKDPIPSTFTTTTDGTGVYTGTYSGKGTASDWFLDGSIDGEHRVYVFENKPGTDTVEGITGYTPSTTYAFIIKGTFIIDGEAANALNRTRYWRVDLTRDDDYHVFRNCSYATTINKVSTPGYGSPEEAEKNNPIIPGKDQTAADVTIRVDQWRLNTYETDM